MHAMVIGSNRIPEIATAMLVLVMFAASARADIFQWEYINPADPSQGKRQSTALAPDGAGVHAVPGVNLSNRDLTMAYLIGADLTNAYGAYANLTNADLSQANLTNADFSYATLTGANLTSAEVRGAKFDTYCGFDFGCNGTGITLAQLYSTASYQAHDLTGINLRVNDLSGWSFAEQNLANADFGGANLTGASLRQANLANAKFVYSFQSSGCFLSTCVFSATLTDAELTAADARGAYGSVLADLDYFGATSTNLILPNGHIHGLDLDAGGLLVVRDHDGNPTPVQIYPFDPTSPIPPISIIVDEHLSMGPGGVLRMVFEADAWDSTISFAPGIPVTLGGTLELTFAADVNPATQLGRTFNLFNWTRVTPTGAFAISSPYQWDVSNLYTTGQVTLTAIPEPSALLLFSLASAASLPMLRLVPRAPVVKRNKVKEKR